METVFTVRRSDTSTGRILHSATFHNEAAAQTIAAGWRREHPVKSGTEKVTVFPSVSRY